MPVDNNEHQRIDGVSIDRISYGTQSLETMGFTLRRMYCLIVLSKRHVDHRSVEMPILFHDLAMFKLF